MQVQRTSEIKVPQLLQMIRQDGFRNLYKGYWVTLWTFGPFSAIYFLVYEKMKDLIANIANTSPDALSFRQYLVAAATASGIAASVTTPFDVVKTRFQVQRRTANVPEDQLYKSVMDGFRKIIRNEGLAALWKGLTARIAYNAPNSAVIMTSCRFT